MEKDLQISPDNDIFESVGALLGLIAKAEKTLTEKIENTEEELSKADEELLAKIQDLHNSLSSIQTRIEDVKKDPGPPGPKPIAGVDYQIPENGKTPTKEELEDIIKPLIPPPVIQKEVIVREVRQNVDLEEIKARLRDLIPTVEDILNSIPAFGERIRDALELLTGDERLDAKYIKNLPESKVEHHYHGGGPSGVKNISAGRNISVTDDEMYAGFKKVSLNITISPTPPESPELNELWIDSS